MEPRDEKDLSEAIAGAAGPLRIRGGGTRSAGEGSGTQLPVAGLSGINLYEPGALTVVAQAGTPVAEIEAALDADGQMLPFEPMDHRPLLGTTGEPTIGGVVAANVSGPRRVQSGACRDSLIGVRFVDGSGTIVKNGGRVMKNVTGYDLVKLMAGSHGTLGVLTEVSFKVLPRPEAVATLRLSGLDAATAVRAMSAALSTPFEVSGAAQVWRDGRSETLLRLEGFSASVAYRAGALAAALGSFGAWERIEGDAARSVWREVRDVVPFAGSEGDVWRVSVKPSDAPEALARAGGGESLLDWGGGLIWLRLPAGTDLRARLKGLPGHATLVRASEETKARLGVFQPEPPALAALAAGLRRQFDPRGILNPGLMGA